MQDVNRMCVAIVVAVAAVVACASAQAQNGPIVIASNKQLFLDEQFFARKQNVSLVVNQPVKDDQPVLVADPSRPWELNRISSGTSVIDDGGVIKLYYDALGPSTYEDRSRWRCYATSTDGVHFTKPNLGIVAFGERTDTNIVWPPTRTATYEPGSVFLDPNPNCPPAERYKMVCEYNSATSMVVSADGLHWTPYSSPSFRYSDTTNTAYFDNRIGRYVGWARYNSGTSLGRQVARCEFNDPHNWGAEAAVFSADAQDQSTLDPAVYTGMDFYNGGVHVYQGAPGVYLGFPAAYFHYRPEVAAARSQYGLRKADNDGPLEVQLITSRDSVNWYRPDRGKAFIPRGPDGSVDDGQTYVMGTSNLIYRGDEIWIYYTAQPFTHGDYALDGQLALGSVMRAVLRRDGFVSVDAGAETGGFTTPTMIFSGSHLTLNVDAGCEGWLRAALLDANGNPLDGYSLADCDAIGGDFIGRTVSWNGRNDLSALAGTQIRMQIEMQNAKLYAFQFPSTPEPHTAVLAVTAATGLLARAWYGRCATRTARRLLRR
jgi:hypothetical protein